MAVCTFFGHRTIYHDITSLLTHQIEWLIRNQNVDVFYVGNQGAFDRAVVKILRSLKEKYPQIQYFIVLAYLPDKKKDGTIDYGETIYPEGLERTPKRFAIAKRNQWMVQQAEYVIVYVEHSYGGAAQFTEYARKKHKVVINLASYSG